MISLFSPAKINLFLRVLHKRSDGYHEIASLMQAISLGDDLTFSLEKKSLKSDVLTTEGYSIPLDYSNLILKAIHLFRQKTKQFFYVKVHVHKKIPLEAGLGGGSSNAATTLWALNELLGCPATIQELINWGAELGSDVAFFFSEGTAFCYGRGEKIQLLDELPQPAELTIVKPSIGLSTPKVYHHLDTTQLANKDLPSILSNFYQQKPMYFNDLEASAFKLSSSLFQLHQHLMQSGYDQVILAGSGSALFCLGSSHRDLLEKELIIRKASYVRRSQDRWYKNQTKECS